MRPKALLLAALLGCAGSPSPVSVATVGQDIVIEGTIALRGIELDLEWDAALAVTDIVLGSDAERLDLLRFEIGANEAKVVLTDQRKLLLPMRGTVLTVVASGTGTVRIRDALGVDENAQAVRIAVVEP